MTYFPSHKKAGELYLCFKTRQKKVHNNIAKRNYKNICESKKTNSQVDMYTSYILGKDLLISFKSSLVQAINILPDKAY